MTRQVDHQAALLTRGAQRVAVAVLTADNPSTPTAPRRIRGVAAAAAARAGGAAAARRAGARQRRCRAAPAASPRDEDREAITNGGIPFLPWPRARRTGVHPTRSGDPQPCRQHRILLFDIDGTLVSTGGAGAVAWRRAFEELHGIPADIGKFTDAGMVDPDVGAKTFEAVLGRKPTRPRARPARPAPARAPARGGRRERGLQGAARRARAAAPAQPRGPPARPHHGQRRRRRVHQARARRPDALVHVRRATRSPASTGRASCARRSAAARRCSATDVPNARDLRDRRHAARHQRRARRGLHRDRRRDRASSTRRRCRRRAPTT